jgi:hypothetical protein
MKWRVVVELAGADGAVQSHEISVGGCGTIDHSADTLGLTLAEGKKTLAGPRPLSDGPVARHVA